MTEENEDPTRYVGYCKHDHRTILSSCQWFDLCDYNCTTCGEEFTKTHPITQEELTIMIKEDEPDFKQICKDAMEFLKNGTPVYPGSELHIEMQQALEKSNENNL